MPPRRLSRDDLPLLAVLAAALLLWAWVCAPVIAGTRTFFLRDVFTTHLPYKAFGAEQLRAGKIPAFNPTWGLGQPFRGNPNALPFYPGNILYLVLPFWSAFGAHFALHWLIAMITMYALARGVGLGKPGALLAGISYAGSGWMLSAMTFYNLLAVAAWWPLVLLGAIWGGRRGIALGGIACGLALLGGEPVAAALGLAPLLLVAVQHRGWKRGFLTAVAIGAVGLLIALPQVVAMLRVLPFTYRGAHGMSAEQAAHFTLHPLRLVELLVPFPYGRPTWLGRYGIWAVRAFPHIPLFLTLYSGIVGLALALPGSRSRPAWAGLAAGGLALAVLGGHAGDLLARLSFGLFRYPEKLLLWPALALPLLAAWGLERVLAGGRRWPRIAGAAGLLFVLLGAVVRVIAPAVLAGAGQGFQRLGQARDEALALLSTQISSWTVALLAAGAALLVAAWAVSRKTRWSAALIVGAQLALLAQLWPLVVTDATAPYKEPAPWASRLGAGAAVLNTALSFPPWGPDPAYVLESGTRIPLERATALDLDPAPGVLHGLTYPFAPDLEGMQSPLFSLLLYNLPRLQGPQRVNWLRVLGLDALVLFEDVDLPGLRLADRATRFGVESRLYRVESPAPRAWWPDEVRVAQSPPAALWAVSNMPDPIASVVVSEPVEHKPGGRVRLLSDEPDRIELEVEGPGGLAIVRRAWQPLFAARAGSRELRTLLVDLNLMGIEVPAGRHRVVLAVSAWPEMVAGGVAVMVLAVALGLLWNTVRPVPEVCRFSMRRVLVRLKSQKAIWTLLALALAAGLGIIAFRHRPASSLSHAVLRTELGLELGPARPFTARLSGLPHAPVGARLATGGGRQLLRTLREQAANAPASLGARALLRMLDRSDPPSLRAAVALLEQGTAEAPADALLWNDLAAAHLARAEQGFPEESIQALSAAQRAVTIDGSLLEARFNLALALERNSLLHQARQAWSEYLEVEEDPGWKAEARAHQRRLDEPTGLTRWERLRAELDAAASRGDKEAAGEIVADFSYRARAHAEEDLLPQWAEAVEAGQDAQAARTLRIAREIGAAVASARGEHMVADSVAAIERVTGSRSREALTSLAAAYRAQAAGSSLCLENQGLKGAAPLLEARRAFARAGSPAILSASYHLAVCAYQRGEPKAALSRLGTLLRRPGMDRYPNLLGRAHWMAGLCSMALAEPGLALDSYQKALHVFEDLGSIPEIGGICNLLADNRLYLGDRRQAWRFHQRGLALAAAEGDPRRLFTALDKAADSAANEGLFEAALRFRDEVVQIATAKPDPPGAAHAHLRRAEVRFRLGHEEAALQDLARAEQACARIADSEERSRRTADILLIQGKIRAVTRPASAFPYLTRALEIYQEDEFRYPLVEIYLTRARVLRAMGQRLAAERDLRSGIEEFERQRDQVRSEELRIAYFDQARDLFDLLIDLQASRPGGAEEAFATAERQRARVLLDRLKPAKPGGADSREIGLLTLSEARRRLPDGVALISYQSLPGRLLIWVLRKNGEPAMRETSLPAATLDKRIAAFLRDVQGGAGDEALHEHLASLHRDVLAPALRYIRPGDLLVFVPDRSLHRLPFAALRDPQSGRHLVEDHASEIVPSASLYLRRTVRPSSVTGPDLLVFANPRFDRRRFEGLPDLGGALDEADALSELLGTGAEVLKGEEATREAFIQEAGRHAVVHLATHALLNVDHPHLSGLLLATDGTGESGVLTAAEISNLSFPHTRLVYLGACQSGSGTVAAEGVLSLARAFLAAGVPRVVSSLWDVDDATASRFSRRFYEALLRHENPEEALRTAQLAAIHGAVRNETSLRHWAAFQVSGARTSHSGEE